MYLLGYDIGSSSVKASLLDAESGIAVASAFSPSTEMDMISVKPGWAEQDPNIWWEHVTIATKKVIKESSVDAKKIKAIGISYQMHGLVLVDKQYHVLRPSIIWCDSRAVDTGEKAFRSIGETVCFSHLLNSPGNFTASKLKWVKDNETQLFKKIHKMMLPGDYIAMKLTDEIVTTQSGLSEGILWDYAKEGTADLLLNYYGISDELLPTRVPTFSLQGVVNKKAAEELGLKAGTPVTYRAGDQPNNAFSLGVLDPGEIAATAGTSGVIYGISDQKKFDPKSRVNTFLHVNHTAENPRYGVLLCINGTGSGNSWVRRLLSSYSNVLKYDFLNREAEKSPIGANGLLVLPFGNGAERMLENKDPGAYIENLRFNTHATADVLKAFQEGIVFAFIYGLDIMKTVGVIPKLIKAGHANMFLSPVFCQAFASLTGARLELYNADGSQGAARAAGVGVGIYKNVKDAFIGLNVVQTIDPDRELAKRYVEVYTRWRDTLKRLLH